MLLQKFKQRGVQLWAQCLHRMFAPLAASLGRVHAAALLEQSHKGNHQTHCCNDYCARPLFRAWSLHVCN